MKAVFFDFGDTLASTVPSYAHRLGTALSELGFKVDLETIDELYVRTDYDVYLKYVAHGSITTQQYIVWFFRTLFGRLGIEHNHRAVYEEMKGRMRHIAFERRPLPGAVELMRELKRGGIKIGVISNNDGRTMAKLLETGIMGYVDAVADSTMVGMVKPDKRIFLHALDQLGVSPHESLHVGDLWGADVRGAISAGIEPVWYNSRGVRPLDDTRVTEIASHGQLLELLASSRSSSAAAD